MLGKDNGWETTPKIRQSLLGYNRPSVINRPAEVYPPPEFAYETLFLDAKAGQLTESRPAAEASVEYQADSRSDQGCSFTYSFDQYTELCGISRAKLFMSTEDHDDMV
jgi:uncharacterized protein